MGEFYAKTIDFIGDRSDSSEFYIFYDWFCNCQLRLQSTIKLFTFYIIFCRQKGWTEAKLQMHEISIKFHTKLCNP